MDTTKIEGVWNDSKLAENLYTDGGSERAKLEIQPKDENSSSSEHAEGSECSDEDHLWSDVEPSNKSSLSERELQPQVTLGERQKKVWPLKQNIFGDYAVLLGDLCLFECLICNTFETSSFYKLRLHVAEKKHAQGHLCQPESFAKLLAYHRCKNCQKQLVHDSHIILTHLTTVCRKRTKVQTNVRRMGYQNIVFHYAAMIDKRERRKCKVLLKTTKYVQHFKELMLKCHVPIISPPLALPTGPPNALPYEKTTHEAVNLCVYECTECGKEVSSWHVLYLHSSACFTRRIGFNTLFVREARYHRCKLCHTVMLADIAFVRSHVYANHKSFQTPFSKYHFTVPVPFKVGPKPMPFYPFEKIKLTPFQSKQIPAENVTREFENLCLFKCDKCFTARYTWRSMSHHGHKCRGSTAFRKEYLVSVVFHECLICQKRVICDKSPIYVHVRTSHGLTKEDYQKTIRNFLVKPIQAVPSSSQSSFIPTVDKPLPKPSNPAGSLPGHLTTDKVGNYCIYECNICLLNTETYYSMSMHMVKHHGASRFTFATANIKEARYHKCFLCARIILCEITPIRKHVQVCHGLNLETYQDKIRIFKDDSASKKVDAKECLRQKVPIASKDLQPDKLSYTLPEAALSKDQMASIAEDLCTFRCLRCFKPLTSWRSLCTHLVETHGMTKQKRFKFTMRYVAEARYFWCKLCSRGVLCDEVLIRRHARYFHNIYTLEKYKTVTSET